MQTRAQQWSASAYRLVKAQKKANHVDKYKTSCTKMPSLIHQSGLLQALVFQVAREDAGVQYVKDLAETYFAALPGMPRERNDHEALIQRAQQLDLHAYMAMTQDLANIAQWFRRFAQIELRSPHAGGK